MARLLVTVGTDGLTDWVRLPNGSKMTLGAVSVLKFVTKLAPTSRIARQALKGFLSGEEVMVPVDEHRMWELLTPRRARWASDGSFIAPDQRTTPTSQGKGTMPTIHDDLLALEQHIGLLNKHASSVTPEKLAEGRDILVRLAQKVASNTDYGFSAVEVAPQQPAVAGEQVEGLTYDFVKANQSLAQDIIVKAEQTVDKIDELTAAGKKFAANRAKADIHAVTSKVAGILADTELSEPWVQEDLRKLAARADYLHGLFIPASQG